MKLQNYLEHIAVNRENCLPISGQINVNSECVNTCRYCLKKTFPRVVLTLEMVRDLVKDFKTIGIKSLIVSGGEPFLHTQIYDILEHLHANEINVSIITSLACKVDVRRAAKYLKRVNVSLDGIKKESYFKTRGTGDVELVKSQLKLFSEIKDKNGFQLNVWTVHSTLNHDEIDSIKEWVAQLNPTSHRINDLRSFEKLKVNKNAGYEKNCGYGFINFIIDASGIVMNCCKLMHDNEDYNTIIPGLIMGNIYDDSFLNIWNSSKAKTIRARIFNQRYKECSECDRAVKINDEINDYLLHRNSKRGEIFL